MPEALVVDHLRKDALAQYAAILKSGYGRGKFRVHSECCARQDGDRQTFTLHKCSIIDGKFQPIPGATVSTHAGKALKVRGKRVNLPMTHKKNFVPSSICQGCNQSGPQGDLFFKKQSTIENPILALHSNLKENPPAEIVNGLGIEGTLQVVTRGKEFMIVIGLFAIRICFGQQGHCLWMPTPMYRAITSSLVVQRGEKSWGYPIPPNYWDGAPGTNGIISIQAAFECPKWTLIFCDHNVLITFHVMALRSPPAESDLQPGSTLWPLLWSHSHGPSAYLEPEDFKNSLDEWRSTTITTENGHPIWYAVKSNQQVFNGYGAQETTDMLTRAHVHPLMPALLVCRNERVWEKFRSTVISYQLDRIDHVRREKSRLVKCSGVRPLRWKQSAHEDFCSLVEVYRCHRRRVTWSFLEEIHRLNLHDPAMVIGDEGHGIYPPEGAQSVYDEYQEPTKIIEEISRGVTTFVNVYAIEFKLNANSTKKYTTYTPFVAQWNKDWPCVVTNFRHMSLDDDFKHEYNKSTLGPYSFNVYVLAMWNPSKVSEMPTTKRLVEYPQHGDVPSYGALKRPSAHDVAKLVKPSKRARKK